MIGDKHYLHNGNFFLEIREFKPLCFTSRCFGKKEDGISFLFEDQSGFYYYSYRFIKLNYDIVRVVHAS